MQRIVSGRRKTYGKLTMPNTRPVNHILDRWRPGLTMMMLTYRMLVETGLLLVEEGEEEGGSMTRTERRDV